MYQVGKSGVRRLRLRFAGALLALLWLIPAAHAGPRFPAHTYLAHNLLRAAEQFPDDVVKQRCWAAAHSVWQYTLDHFGPDHARAWFTPWWYGGHWRKLCDGEGLRSVEESSHWGITCPYRQCPEGDGPYISINHDRIYSGLWPESWLHGRYYYVMAHEMAHAIGHYYGDPRWADDHWADAVARAFGAPVCAHSPYCRADVPNQALESGAPSNVLVVPPLAPVGD
ncbi:MAG: hypothetical protein GVY32_10310 [Gammaproteobacteria bacterium]|jgi:GAF domain-containing protein|nr:hypothetical protein [Gammaproteobacteria bacterium]